MTDTYDYEQVSFESLPNRPGSVERFLGRPVTPEQAFVVLAPKPDGTWENVGEYQRIEDTDSRFDEF